MEEITNKELQEQINNLTQENKKLQEEINKLMIDKINLIEDTENLKKECIGWKNVFCLYRSFTEKIGLEDYIDKCCKNKSKESIIKTQDIKEIINKQENVEIKFWTIKRDVEIEWS